MSHYPEGICVYCGMAADSRDHVLPRHFTGVAGRKSTPTVPACKQCNSMLSDAVYSTIQERREHVQERIRQRYAKVLAYPEHTERELASMGHTLRSAVEYGLARKRFYEAKLEWPVDDDYDARAQAY